MILVVGGTHSGKRTFVREKLGFAADDFVDAAQLAEGGGPPAFAGPGKVSPRHALSMLAGRSSG